MPRGSALGSGGELPRQDLHISGRCGRLNRGHWKMPQKRALLKDRAGFSLSGATKRGSVRSPVNWVTGDLLLPSTDQADALACALTADRFSAGTTTTEGQPPEVDEGGQVVREGPIVLPAQEMGWKLAGAAATAW